jgi:hypothetical protein
MIRFLKALILLPVAIVVVLLAVANRQAVTVSFDPFSQGAPAFSATVPLYALAFAAVALGILIGGCGAWLGQGTVRRDRRLKHREVDRLRRESDRLRTAIDADRPAALPAPAARA